MCVYRGKGGGEGERGGREGRMSKVSLKRGLIAKFRDFKTGH